MANTYKNTKTLNPALRSIGNMNVRGVVKGGTSDADKAERYGLPVMVSETGYIDASLIEGGGGGGGTTEERVKELINENLQPYNNGNEIKADVETKITSATADVMISNKLQPYTDGQAIKNEVDTKQTATQVEVAITDRFQPYNDGQEIKDDIDAKVSKLELPEAIKEQIQQSTEIKTEITNIVGETLNPYTNGQEIKDEVDGKVNTTDYDADFNNFDAETGNTKGEKIQNYIDDLAENKVDISAMSPYEDDPSKIGVAIQNAITAATKTDDEIKMLAEAKITEDCEVGGTIDDAINAKIGDNLLEKTDLAPYGQTDKTQTGSEIETAIAEKVDYVEFETFESEVGDNIGEKIRSAITGGSQGITESKLSECLSPYSTSSADITEIGTKIKADADAKLATTAFDSEFSNFDGEQGVKKGEKIQNYIDGVVTEKVDVTAMSPYDDDPATIGIAISDAIEEVARTDQEIKNLAEVQIVADVGVGGTIDTAIDAKLTNTLTPTDLSPYGQTDKSQTGTEIAAALALKADAADVSGKVDTTTYDADFSNFGVSGHSKGENIANYVNAQGALKVDITAMAPYADEPSKIGEAIQAAIDGGGGISTETFQQYMSPYGATSASTTGTEIKSGLDAKLSTATFDTEFAAFGQGADTKGELIKNYVDSQMNGKLNISAMDPFIGDESDVGQNIADAIDEKLDADTLKTYMEPYGQQDITQLGNDIKEAISAVSKTDNEIKALAESQITTDIADGGTIDTAIDNKLTAENVLRQSDLSPFGDDDITETGADIQIAINAVDAKTKTDAQIQALADGQIALNAVEPTDMGDFYDDDKTQIGANIKAAILSGGDPSNPTVKQSDMAPYGVNDITQTGAEIHTAISTAITNAFVPYNNGLDISTALQAQQTDLNNKINNVANSIIPSVKEAFDAVSYKIKNSSFNLPENIEILSTTGNGSAGFETANKIFFFTYNKTTTKIDFCYFDKTTETTEVIAENVGVYTGTRQDSFVSVVNNCYNEPSKLVAVAGIRDNGSVSINRMFAMISVDGGETWIKKYNVNIPVADSATISPFSNILLDKNGDYIAFSHMTVSTTGNYFHCYKLDFSTEEDSYLFVESVGFTHAGSASGYKAVNIYKENNIHYAITLTTIDNQYVYGYFEPTWQDLYNAPVKDLSVILQKAHIKYPDGTTMQFYTYFGLINPAENVYIFNNIYFIDAGYKYYHIGISRTGGSITSEDNPLIVDPIGDSSSYGLSNQLSPVLFLNDKFIFASVNYNGSANVSYLFELDYVAKKLTTILTLTPLGDLSWNLPTISYNNNIVRKTLPSKIVLGKYDAYYFRVFELYTQSVLLDSFKVGDILVTCRNPGANWLECNGSTFTATEYPLLAEIITDLTLPTATPSWITGGTTTFKAYIKAE